MSSKMFKMALMMAGMAASAMGDNSRRNESINRLGESKEEREKRLSEVKIKQNLSKGLKEFNYPKGSVWAINQKSADKKAKKLNLS